MDKTPEEIYKEYSQAALVNIDSELKYMQEELRRYEDKIEFLYKIRNKISKNMEHIYEHKYMEGRDLDG